MSYFCTRSYFRSC